MPTYEYVCEKCGAHLDIFQSMKDAPLKTCPREKCARKPWAKGRVKRELSGGAGLIFKGSGFYATDYKKSGNGGSSKTKKPEACPAAEGGSCNSCPNAKAD
mgnify:CR=1 FL=1